MTEILDGWLKEIDCLEREDAWSEHPRHDRGTWRDEAADGNTQLGYWDWCRHRVEQDYDDLHKHNAEDA